MKKIFIIIAALTLTMSAAVAQDNQAGGNKKISAIAAFEVNGVKFDDEVITLSVFKKKFGQPTKTEKCNSETIYTVGESGYTLINDRLSYVLIRDNKVTVLGETIPGGIKVGDKASDAKAKIKQYTTSKTIDFDYGEVKGFIIGSWDVKINMRTNDAGYITEISYGEE